MNQICKMYLHLIALLSIPLVIVIFSCRPVSALHTDLGGNSFTDPDKVYSMSSEWINRPIVYESSSAGADLVISLGQHLYPYLTPKIEEYAKKNNLKIVVDQGTCGITAGKLSKKSVDIGGLCCAPGTTDRLPGLRYHTMGIAALLLIVHPDNPVKNITFDEAQKIFTGDIYKWSELRTDAGGWGNDVLIQPISRMHCKLRPGHWRLLLDNEDLFSTAVKDVGAIPDVIHSVASNTKAIGYETMTSLDRYFKETKNIGVTPLRINGLSHDETSNLISGNYPMYRVFNLSTWDGDQVSNHHADNLVRYLAGEVKKLDRALGIIPASELRNAGWEFHGDELTGEPR